MDEGQYEHEGSQGVGVKGGFCPSARGRVYGFSRNILIFLMKVVYHVF